MLEHRSLYDTGTRRNPILSTGAIYFLEALHERFAADIAALAPATSGPRVPAWIQLADWRTPQPPVDLQDRSREVIVPAEPRLLLRALNSGARAVVADLTDTRSHNTPISAQIALRDAAERRLQVLEPTGQTERLSATPATLIVRPRALGQGETAEGERASWSAGLFDFGLYCYHAGRTLSARGSGPLFDLYEVSGRAESRLWNDIFLFAQKYIGLTRASIRATLHFERQRPATEIEALLFELREHSTGVRAPATLLADVADRRGEHTLVRAPLTPASL